jgi:hypothetical protein
VLLPPPAFRSSCWWCPIWTPPINETPPNPNKIPQVYLPTWLRLTQFANIRRVKYNAAIMAAKRKDTRKGDRHRPGYRSPGLNFAVYLTRAEYEAFARRAEQDGLPKHRAAKSSLLNYIKHGIGNG